MNIFLIRHGLTVPGEEGRYQGFLDEGLSEKGKALLTRAPQRPSHVYVSPARRARETASILFPEAEQVCISDLWEMNFGEFEGHSWRELSDDPDYRRWVDGMCLGTCPGGESRASFSRRVCKAFLGILDREKEWQRRCGEKRDLFIVSHGGTQMALLERWGSPARDYYSWQSPCGAGWVLKRSGCPRPAPDGTEPQASHVLQAFDPCSRQRPSGVPAPSRDHWDAAGKAEDAPEDFLLQAVRIISFTKNP